MSSFSEEENISSEETPLINAVDAKIEGNQLTLTDENGKKITLTLTEDALRQLPEVFPSTPPETAGGSRRRKSRKHKAVKRRNKSQRRHRR
jgi:hypothetical protein